jgi:hypothetical protein
MGVLSALVLTGVAGYFILQKSKTIKLNKQFQGDFNLPISEKYLKKDQHGYGEKVFSCELIEQNAFHSTLARFIKHWIGPLKNGFTTEMIEIVQNRDKFNHFRQQIEIVESRAGQPVFQPNLNGETNIKERQKVLKRLESLYEQVVNSRKAHIVRVWHGTNKKLLPYLLGEGFASLGITDDGWFGKGMYFSSSAEYASRYCPKDENACLLMCYVLVLNPFPVISDDAPAYIKRKKISNQNFRFFGTHNYHTHQCHYIPVAQVVDSGSELDYRPPPKGIDDAIYDELVVFDNANILPQIVVHLKRTSPLPSKTQYGPAPTSTPPPNTSTAKATQNHGRSHRSADRRRTKRSPTQNEIQMNMIEVLVDQRDHDGDYSDRQRRSDHRQNDKTYNVSVIDVPTNDNSWRNILRNDQPFDGR